MKIVYKFGPRAGEVAHVPRSAEIQVLLNAGIIEEVPLTETEKAEVTQAAGHTIPPYFRTPVWEVIKHDFTGAILVQRKHLSETLLFDGVPDRKKWPDLSNLRETELAAKFAQMKAQQEAQALANEKEIQRSRREAR